MSKFSTSTQTGNEKIASEKNR